MDEFPQPPYNEDNHPLLGPSTEFQRDCYHLVLDIISRELQEATIAGCHAFLKHGCGKLDNLFVSAKLFGQSHVDFASYSIDCDIALDHNFNFFSWNDAKGTYDAKPFEAAVCAAKNLFPWLHTLWKKTCGQSNFLWSWLILHTCVNRKDLAENPGMEMRILSAKHICKNNLRVTEKANAEASLFIKSKQFEYGYISENRVIEEVD